MKHNMRHLQVLLLELVSLSLFSCYGYDDSERDANTANCVNINIYVPRSTVTTRADEGTTPGTDAENALHKTCIWIYENDGGDDGLPIAFAERDLSGLADADGKYTVQVPLPASTIMEQKPVDVFVVANVEAISTATFPTNITRSQLLQVDFGHAGSADNFGVTTPTGATAIGTGLPMSDYVLDQNIYTNNEINSNGVSLSLKRAVSKIRFVFARNTGIVGVSVTGVTLDGSVIPTSEYVFPAKTVLDAAGSLERTPNLPADVTYEASTTPCATTTLQTASIIASDNPASLVFQALSASETGTDYVSRLDQALTDNLADDNLTSAQTYGLTYLRESDKVISGTISYRMDGDTEDTEDHTRTFTMQQPYDFTRNHYYIVYGYFTGDAKLEVVCVYISNWTNGGNDSHEVYNW